MSTPSGSMTEQPQPSKKRRVSRRSQRIAAEANAASSASSESIAVVGPADLDDTLELPVQGNISVNNVSIVEVEPLQEEQVSETHSSSSSRRMSIMSVSQLIVSPSVTPPPFRPFEQETAKRKLPRQLMTTKIVGGPSTSSAASAVGAGPASTSNSNQEMALVPISSGPAGGEGQGDEGFDVQDAEVILNQQNCTLEQQQQPVVVELEQEQQQLQQIRLLPQTVATVHQSHVQDHGWQEARLKLTDRASFLLNNPRMSDIRFIVGETRVEVFGHKTLLAMGSPVFEAQFFGSMHGDNETIELPEFEPETFVTFLRYLYTDSLDEPIDDMKVLQLLKPAKKYIVPHLIEKCSDILMSELRPENVFQIHNYADFFDLPKLEGACLRFIDRECESLIQTEEFTMLAHDTLTEFLKRDGLNIKEDTLFKAVLRWAELDCERKGIETTDANIRIALGDNLKLIRFPTMSPEEFAADVAARTILTAEEAKSIFIYMCIGYPNRMNPTFIPEFPTKKRGFYPQQYLVSRFSGEPVPHSLNYRSGEIYTYRFNIKADRQIFFKGVNIFSIKCGSNAQYVDQRRFNGAVYLYECDVIAGDRDLSREKARKQFSKDSALESEYETSSGSRYFPVLFDQEIRIPANQLFTVCAVVSVASSNYHQQSLLTYVGMDEISDVSVRCADDLQVNFTFSNCYGEANVGKYTQSQIPEIVFSL